MNPNVLKKIKKQIEELQSFSTQSPNGLVINRLVYKNSGTCANNVLEASRKYNYNQLEVIASRWNELVSIMCTARFYLLESVSASKDHLIYDSIESTRLMHFYTACLWYNSIIDSILQLYFLIEHAHEIYDDNYEEMLKDKKHKRNAQIRRSCIPKEDLSQFAILENKMQKIRGIANKIKHRRVVLLPNNLKDKHSIGVFQIDSYNENGMPHFIGLKSLSSTKLQTLDDDFENLIKAVIEIDREDITYYLNLLQKKFFSVQFN